VPLLKTRAAGSGEDGDAAGARGPRAASTDRGARRSSHRHGLDSISNIHDGVWTDRLRFSRSTDGLRFYSALRSQAAAVLPPPLPRRRAGRSGRRPSAAPTASAAAPRRRWAASRKPGAARRLCAARAGNRRLYESGVGRCPRLRVGVAVLSGTWPESPETPSRRSGEVAATARGAWPGREAYPAPGPDCLAQRRPSPSGRSITTGSGRQEDDRQGSIRQEEDWQVGLRPAPHSDPLLACSEPLPASPPPPPPPPPPAPSMCSISPSLAGGRIGQRSRDTSSLDRS
jgi:hypothetical protein